MSPTWPDDGLLVELYVQAERTATRLVGADRAGDIANETIVRLLTRWAHAADFPHAWVTQVSANLAIDALRKRSPHLPPVSSQSFETDTVVRLSIAQDLKHLSRRQRQVIVLHYLLGFTDVEVARTLQVSLPTVKTHLRRALSGLRRHNSLTMEVEHAPADPT
jgi:RNA polymerase sigma factor (sigma-70 family)